jgi:hypothetical protein
MSNAHSFSSGIPNEMVVVTEMDGQTNPDAHPATE